MNQTLERNLRALAVASPNAAAAIRAASPRPDVEFIESPEGALTAIERRPGGLTRALASSKRPLAEARAIAGSIDVRTTPGVVALGFGLGHHVAEVARALKRTGVLLCHEPDVGLLRAVLERIDHSEWIRASNFALLTHADDPAAIGAIVQGSEGIFAVGTAFLEHPASRARAARELDAFATRFTTLMRAVRTTIVTTLVQSEATLRNLLMNADWYVSCPGVAELAGLGAGRPAVVVSAGPSLRRNIDLLAAPGVRDRVVIVAVQTVLKQLLERGIRPHFVVALDHHEISRRFYEGLTPEQVAGVTLVVEPRANPAILESFPGAIRCAEDEWLEDVLGGIVPPKGKLKAGATVAHLAYTLARHLGCDPVILIGQDLGFSDGQYYAAGAAIHSTWAAELNPFRTLEMMEWERIARSKRLLRRLTDVHGRPIYTDEQMATYLVQFEQMFVEDAARGLTTLDATEGGVAKRHTTPTTLADALNAVPASLPPFPLLDAPARRNAANIRAARERVARARREAAWVRELSLQALKLLNQMRDAYPDQRRINALISRIEPITREVQAQKLGLALVSHLNQVGALNRFKADRAIAMEESLTPAERQQRQIERDIDNVERIADAAAQVGTLLDATLEALAGGPKVTRDVAPPESAEAGATERGPVPTVALIPVEPDVGSLGVRRRLGDAVIPGLNTLQLTLARLARSRHVRRATLITPDPARVRELLGAWHAPGFEVSIVPVEPGTLEARRAAVAAARLFSPASWRGGIAGLSIYDEVMHPRVMARALNATDAQAALILGPDWCAVDPSLCDALVERHSEHPGGTRVTFTQAAPGIAPCLVARSLLDELATRQEDASWLAAIGASLAYIPIGPQSDPIAKVCCVPVEPALRDLPGRAILDLPVSRHALLPVLSSLGERAIHADAAELVSLLTPRFDHAPPGPHNLTLELCTGRLTSGLRGTWLRGREDVAERPPLDLALGLDAIEQGLALNRAMTLTLAGAGDPLRHPGLYDLIHGARERGCRAIHLRTDLLCEADTVDHLLDSGLDVISVDLMATTRETYRALMGVDQFETAGSNLVSLLEGRRALPTRAGLPALWVVPRMTRADATLAEVEPFYDHWLTIAGACVIDALPARIPGERIEPLPLPSRGLQRLWREDMTILADGTVPLDGHEHAARLSAGRLVRGDASLAALWRGLCTVRHETLHGRTSGPRAILAA